jgi:UDP-GlcNAc:undecaprenyl-phosphate GlcNAc-1-phosphate transferase
VEQAQIVPAFLPIALPLAVVALPLIDLSLAVVRRARAGKMFWQPDKMHLHHRMLQLGHSHARAVLIMYVWTATLAFGVASVAFVSPLTAVLGGVAAVVVAVVLTLGPLRGRRAEAVAVRRREAAARANGAGPDDVTLPSGEQQEAVR